MKENIVTRITISRPRIKSTSKKQKSKKDRKPPKPKFRYVYKGGGKKITQSDKDKISKLGYIPYSWDEVDIYLNDAKVVAVGILKGIKRYLYKKEFREKQNDKKCDRMKEFGKQLKTIKDNIFKEISRDEISRKKVIATGLWILLMSSIRVGNTKYLNENGTYGLTTLQKKHVDIKNSNLILDFVGKKSVNNYVNIKIPKKLVDWFISLKKNADPFFLEYKGSRINAQEINDYIKDHYGDEFTAKDFRTWGANVIFLNRLAELNEKDLKEMKQKDVNKLIKKIVEETAEKLNNTPSVLKSNYLCHHILDRLKENPYELIKRVKSAKDIDKLLIDLL